MRRSSLPALLLALLVGCAIAAGLWFVHSTEVHNCQQVELVKTRIRDVIEQGTRTLGRPGSAGYAYYLEHPAELAQAQANARAALHTFAAGPC